MNSDTSPLDAALFWIERAFLPVPAKFRSKKAYNPGDPEGRKWQDLRITAETAPQYFNSSTQNIGVFLGDDYGSADVDLDCLEAVSTASHFLPDTGMKFGRASKPASHWFYRIDPPIPSEKFTDPTDGTTLLELRCRKKDGSIGHQTVVPPSVHESGEAIRFEDGFDRHPANVAAGHLQAAVRSIAMAALLVRHWPAAGGGRHETMLALAGVVQRAGWTEEDAAQFCLAVYRAVPDHDRSAIARTEREVRDTFQNATAGRATTGIPSLRHHFDERVVRRALAWLRIESQEKRRSPSVAQPAPWASERADSLPKICVGARQLPVITREVLTALQAANEPPEMFARSGRMVAIVRDERNRHVIAEVTEAAVRGRMARSAFYYRLNRDHERVECVPPLDVVRDILALSPAEWKFPPLEALIEVPFLRSDGTICDRPGYDAGTCLFYAPALGFHLLEIPEAPTRDHVNVSLELLDSAIGDFPFADDASRANAVASMLTPLVRPAIDSPTPLALYDAPQAGTGKTLLAEVVSIIATGRAAETFSAPNDLEEWRKKITTALSTGTNVVLIDNVNHRLDSDALCMALTAITISDRVFRTFERIVLPVKCAWIATGNNIQLGGDMPRRCYWIRLDAKQSQPFRRTGFRHANLRAWVTEHRGELIAALLTLARYWFLQGRPTPKRIRPLGSFEAWCETVGGMLETVGVEGFLGNADIMFEQADAEAAQWESFLLVLAELFNGDSFRVTEVVEKLPAKDDTSTPEMKRLRGALPDFLAEAADRTGGFFQRRLGKCFADRVGRRFGESQVFLERADEDRKAKVQRWRVQKP
jgi:hypothetical protein